MAEPFVHEPCAFNPKGAEKEFCTHMTGVLRHNKTGCCAIQCTSPFRVCWKCITESPTPRLCQDPDTGLCAEHANPGAVRSQMKERTPRFEEPSIWDDLEERPKRAPRLRPDPSAAPAPPPPRVKKPAARPAATTQPSQKPRVMPAGFKRPVRLDILTHIHTAFKKDVEDLERTARQIERDWALLLSEPYLTDEMRAELRSYAARLREALQSVLFSISRS